MAAATAVPVDDAAAPPVPWHTQLQASVADFERAAAALLAVCEAPEATAELEVRVRATHAAQRSTHVAQRVRRCR